MPEYHIYAICGVFGAVILCIAFNLMDMTLAALIGLCLLTLAGTIANTDVLNAVLASEGALSLLFGGMVVARVLAPTGIFEHVGTRFLIQTRGSGKRFLLLLTGLVAVVCAILPNATAVILIAPILIRVCEELDVDFVGPMILTAMLSNAAGLLTLVGDPATFLVGQAMGLSFVGYLRTVSLGGALAILVIIPLMPLLFPTVWKSRRSLPAGLAPPPIKRKGFCAFSLAALAVMVVLFLIGEAMPHPVLPPSAAIIGASLALLAIHTLKIEPVEAVLRDIDWKTLLFIFCMMCYVEIFTKTGLMSGLSRALYAGIGDDILLAAFALLGAVGLVSGYLANIPVVAASILMVKGYLVLLQLAPEEALGAGFTDWPQAAFPVFVAMMFGGTLGGNATLIGASSNLVAVGVCAAHGRPVRFGAFLRYGVPVTLCQLAVAAVYVWALTKIG
ncbi:citrate transporter [Desulfovibrio sulfodismutans]|uniref:Citrate transporter n=1 Tax=Desulfolutivibrio sulfodismutans TaxID=63561 RepID=A0A7K3NH03_9BACT|nr:SLC13 family permease [Desulfolutivibrio sulfodismutans]NDY55472.1 citrate transporter [Desulfolutivibrio sulfodismutans]QLA12860.1 citrate transporter [Desulfolutivibrio sulfodismutans DSM 3696]